MYLKKPHEKIDRRLSCCLDRHTNGLLKALARERGEKISSVVRLAIKSLAQAEGVKVSA